MSHVTPILPTDFTPRQWQVDAMQLMRRQPQQDYLIAACPGSGKTKFAAMVVVDLMKRGLVERVVVIVPSDGLRSQWAKAFTEFQIDLDYKDYKYLSSDFHGFVQSYQTLSRNAGVFSQFTRQYRTLVILDEPHHMADDPKMSWGAAAVEAFGHDNCVRLLITGTPFRTDNSAIPFVRYSEPDAEGYRKCETDFEYSYGDALRDKIVRSVGFPVYDAEMTWIDEGGRRTVGFNAALRPDDKSKALATFLKEQSDAVRKMLREGLDLVRDLRQTDPQAGGLVVCTDQKHARHIASELKRMGASHVVVTSDEEGARQKIDDFKSSSEEFIVAVRMVAEGIDIKRLRVGVYLSNITAAMYVIQVIGRVLRVREEMDGQDLQAYFFFPNDDRLREIIVQIQRMREHAIQQRLLDEMEAEMAELGGDGASADPLLFVPQSVEYTGTEYISVDGALYPIEVIQRAREVMVQYGITATVENYIRSTRDLNDQSARITPTRVVPVKDAQIQLRKEVWSLAGKVVSRRYGWIEDRQDLARSIAAVKRESRLACRIPYNMEPPQMSLAQLESLHNYLVGQLIK